MILFHVTQKVLYDIECIPQILRGHRRSDDLIGDFCDAEACKSHPLFSRDPQALQILLYYDDLEVANPLGSHTKVHKLGRKWCRYLQY